MTIPVLMVGPPSEFGDGEKGRIRELIVLGHEVDPEGLMKRVKECHRLATITVDGIIVAVGAIKAPDHDHLRGVAERSQTPQVTSCRGELGYLFTEVRHRGKGYSGRLVKGLLAGFRGPLYATARSGNTPSESLLRRADFIQSGKPWPSREHPDKHLRLWLRED
jgi:hypothetical protein